MIDVTKPIFFQQRKFFSKIFFSTIFFFEKNLKFFKLFSRIVFFFGENLFSHNFFFKQKKIATIYFGKKISTKFFWKLFFLQKIFFHTNFFQQHFFQQLFFFENFFCDIKLSSCIHLVVAGVGGNWSRDGAWKFYWRWERGGGASVSLYPPAPRSGWGVYWFELVCPSVRLWTTSFPLCIFHNNSRIHIIFIHLIKQLQKVCRVLTFFKNSKIWIFADF